MMVTTVARWTALVVVVVVLVKVEVEGHGRLVQPPGRSTAWRQGFATPPNYNDHEIYCGGFGRQWRVNGGKCGVCGDPWDTPQPRANEGGGKYGLGVITATWREGAEVEIGVELTANHNGYFEFRLCPHNRPKTPVSQGCLDRYLLQRPEGGHRYYPGPGSRKFLSTYVLPAQVTCRQCVLQWRYVTASNWGTCANGTGMMGCGNQEEFRGCADVSIIWDDGSSDKTPSVTTGAPHDDASDEVASDEDDYNEVDTGPQTGDKKPVAKTNDDHSYVGHIVAITLACVLFPLLILLIVLYLYFGKDRVRKFLKTSSAAGYIKSWCLCCSRRNESSTTGGAPPQAKAVESSPLDFPHPPVAPPRRFRRNSFSNSDQETISTIPV